MAEQFDVIVVGCGPVGAAAANLLAERGLSVCVIEPNESPYALPRAIHFDHEVMRILQSAGLADAILPLVHVPAGSMVFGVDRHPIRPFRPGKGQPALGWSASYFYRQPAIEAAMRAALSERPNVTLMFGQQVMDVAQDAASVTATTGDGAVVSAQYLIACDGARSVVRRSLGIALDDLNFDEPWIVVDALVDGEVTLPPLHDTPPGVDMRDVMFTIADPVRPMSYIPGAGQHRRWEFMLLPGETVEDYENGEKVAALIDPWVTRAAWHSLRQAVYRFHALIADRWRDRRVFLAGDAAHQTPPFFGQGLCHGVRDAANLAWKLEAVIKHGADDALLDTYEVERKPQVRAVVDLSVKMGRYICTLDPQIAAKRDIDLRQPGAPIAAADLIPPLRAGIIGTAGTIVGGRFIQPPMTQAGRTALLDRFTGKGFVVLVRADAPDPVDLSPELVAGGATLFRIAAVDQPDDRQSNVLVDHSGELLRWFDSAGAFGVIVRPDFYVYDLLTTAEEASLTLRRLADQLSGAKPGSA